MKQPQMSAENVLLIVTHLRSGECCLTTTDAMELFKKTVDLKYETTLIKPHLFN